MPPKVGSVWARLRCWEPVPHDLVQVDHAEKAEVAQWMAHGPWVQTWVSAVCAQALPPQMGWVSTRVRPWLPAPHDVVQVDQADQAAWTQSTAHANSLHERVSV